MEKEATSGIILTVLLISILTLAFNFQVSTYASSDSDWVSGWSYRKSHIINSVSGAGTNYQIKIKVRYGTGTDSGQDVYLNNHGRADFGDVRFTDDDGTTELDYWMEEKVDGDYAIFWVEVADDLSSSSATTYIYYGNADATTTSNGTNTFIGWDDFDDYSIGDPPKSERGWTYDNGEVSVQLDPADSSNKVLALRTTTTAPWAKMTWVAKQPNVALCTKHRVSANEIAYGPYAIEDATAIFSVKRSDPGKYDWYDGDSWEDFNPTAEMLEDLWYKLELRLIKGVSANLWKDTYVYTGGFRNSMTTGVNVLHFGRINGENNYNYIDSVYIRKFVDPEPSHGSWGPEEMLNPPIASFVFSPADPIVAETVTFDASTSNDPDGIIVSYAWDFGDGNITITVDPIITHVYTLSGAYNVTLTVTDNDELTDTSAKSIDVGKLSSTISISVAPTTITIGKNTTVSGSISPTRVGASVTIWHRLGGTETWSILTTIPTDSNSQYSYAWTPSEVGTYEVKANWTGDANTLPAESPTITLLVTPHRMLSVKLSGEFDYGLREDVRVKLVALVRDAVTMEPVSNSNVTVQIYGDAGGLLVSSVMVEKLAGTGIYEWRSRRTIRDLGVNKGIYLVRARASFEDGPPAYDVLLFHIDPPAGKTNETLYYIAMIVIVFASANGLIFKRRQIIKRLRRLKRPPN